MRLENDISEAQQPTDWKIIGLAWVLTLADGVIYKTDHDIYTTVNTVEQQLGGKVSKRAVTTTEQEDLKQPPSTGKSDKVRTALDTSGITSSECTCA